MSRDVVERSRTVVDRMPIYRCDNCARTTEDEAMTPPKGWIIVRVVSDVSTPLDRDFCSETCLRGYYG